MAGMGAIALAYMLSQFYRSFLAVLTPALTADLGATKADLSLASGIWFAAFALMQFVVGVCLDRYGPRATTASMLAVGAAGAFVFAAATAPWMIVAGMALIGIGCAPVLMAAIFIFARTLPAAQLSVRTSWLVAFGLSGNVIGTSPLASAAEAFGWRGVLVGLGVATLLVALALALFVRDPERAPSAGETGFGFAGYRELLRIRNIWLIAPLVALGYAPSSGIRGLWAGPYLSEVHGADVLAIGQVVLFMALAMVAGALIYGPLDTLLRSRKWVAAGGNALGVVVIAALAFNPLADLTTVTVLFVLVGMFCGTYGVLMAHGRAFVPAHLTGRGVTLLNFFSVGGTGLIQFATGGVYAASYVPGDPAAAYQALFGFYAVALALAVAIYLFAPDARPEKPAEEIGASAG